MRGETRAQRLFLLEEKCGKLGQFKKKKKVGKKTAEGIEFLSLFFFFEGEEG